MNKTAKTMLYLLPIVLLAIFVYSYFHVSGSEIDGVADIGPGCTVTVEKSLAVYSTKLGSYTLTLEGTDALRELLLDSSFTRELSNVVRVDDYDQYDLRIEFPDGRDPLIATVLGGKFLSAVNRFDGKHLKINTPDFKERLEEILNTPALAVPEA